MTYAGVAHRFVAVLIDGAFFFVLAMVIALLPGGAYSHTSIRATMISLLVFFAYYVIGEAFFGRTIGKRFVGLRVVGENGDHIGLGAALVRNLLRIVDGLFFYLVAAAAVWSSPRRQRIGDRAAHTFVVRDRRGHPAAARSKPRVSEQPSWVTRDWAGTYTRDDFMTDVDRANHFRSSHSH